MLKPFDLRAALTAKQAQHVVLIHFPIRLFIAGAAYFNFLVAALASVPTMITEGTLLRLMFGITSGAFSAAWWARR